MGELSFRACTGTVCVFHVCDQARDNTSQLTAERQLPCRSRGQRSCCAILGSSHTLCHLLAKMNKLFKLFIKRKSLFHLWVRVHISMGSRKYIIFPFSLCCKPPLSPYLPLHYLSPCPSTEPLIYGANNSCDDFISDWRLIFSLAYADRTRTAHIAVNQVRGSTSGRGLGGGSDREMRRKWSINGMDRVNKRIITELTVWGEKDFLP